MPENLCPERAQKTRPERAKPATWPGIELHPERANLQPGARLGGCSIPGRVVLTRAGYASNSPQIYSISFYPLPSVCAGWPLAFLLWRLSPVSASNGSQPGVI
jgi:hypothetical protein